MLQAPRQTPGVKRVRPGDRHCEAGSRGTNRPRVRVRRVSGCVKFGLHRLARWGIAAFGGSRTQARVVGRRVGRASRPTRSVAGRHDVVDDVEVTLGKNKPLLTPPRMGDGTASSFTQSKLPTRRGQVFKGLSIERPAVPAAYGGETVPGGVHTGTCTYRVFIFESTSVCGVSVS